MKRITHMPEIGEPLQRVRHAETGVIGEVIDLCDGYRVRVQWPTGRITRVDVDDLRPA